MQKVVVPQGVDLSPQVLVHLNPLLEVPVVDQNPLQEDLNREIFQTLLLKAVVRKTVLQVTITIAVDQEVFLSQYRFFHIIAIALEDTLVVEA